MVKKKTRLTCYDDLSHYCTLLFSGSSVHYLGLYFLRVMWIFIILGEYILTNLFIGCPFPFIFIVM